MKTIIQRFIGVLLFFGLGTSVFSQQFEWCAMFGSDEPSNEQVAGVAIDTFGNVYVTGRFEGTFDFDPGPGVYNITAAGTDKNAVVAKYDSSRVLKWVIQLGGGGSDEGRAIKLDNLGHIYVMGIMDGNNIDFDPGPGVSNLSSNGGEDVFIWKLDTAGNFVWARNYGCNMSYDDGTQMAVDVAGSVYITGWFYYTTDFNPGMGTASLITNGLNDVYLLKIDSSGNFRWVKQIGGTQDDAGYAVYARDGYVYYGGSYQSGCDFDPGPGTFFMSGSNYTAFISKLDTAGNFIWAIEFDGPGTQGTMGITVDSIGNVISSGYFYNAVDFNPGTAIYTLTSLGQSDIFLAKLDSAGNFIWAKQMGGTNYSYGSDVVLDQNEDIYMAGTFFGAVDFDPGAGTSNVFISNNESTFLTKFNPNGTFQYVKAFGNQSTTYLHGLDVFKPDVIVLTGSFADTLDCDPGIGVSNLIEAGLNDGFIIKLGKCLLIDTLIKDTVCYSYTSPSGNYIWTTTGTYNDVLSAYNGCDSLITVNLVVNDPTAAVTQNDSLLTCNTPGATYQWLNCTTSFSPVTGAINQNFIPPSGGNYAVTITLNGCSDTSGCFQVIFSGLHEMDDENALHIYPNPAGSTLWIDNVLFNGSYSLIILSSQGEILRREFPGKNSVDISDLPNGIYVLEISYGSKLQRQRFIKIN